jgi:hypothetical protein|nr:MAG TPA: hypothetical protein [Caudoviricetes sp.]
MQNNDILDLFERALEDKNVKLQTSDEVRLQRLKEVYAHWIDRPLLSDSMIRDYIIANYEIGRAQAYNDIALIKAIFGNAPKADKEFQRFRANKLLEMAAAAALAGNHKKANSLRKISESIIKANQLDEDEGEEMRWSEIVPVDVSFTVDPSVIGIEKVAGIEEKSKKLLDRYIKEIDEQ